MVHRFLQKKSEGPMPLRQAEHGPTDAAAMLAMKGSDLTGAWIRTLNAVVHLKLSAASKLERDPNEETGTA
jgi:hypothetical protein